MSHPLVGGGLEVSSQLPTKRSAASESVETSNWWSLDGVYRGLFLAFPLNSSQYSFHTIRRVHNDISTRHWRQPYFKFPQCPPTMSLITEMTIETTASSSIKVACLRTRIRLGIAPRRNFRRCATTSACTRLCVTFSITEIPADPTTSSCTHPTIRMRMRTRPGIAHMVNCILNATTQALLRSPEQEDRCSITVT
jgi:hypothetical protein